VTTTSRRGTAGVVRQICEMVRVLRNRPMTRAEFARRWGVTRRQVSHVVDRADAWFGVRLEHRHGEGYVLRDTGILDPRRLGGDR
jgi:predicted DNA-binding transcriptional regulator YafY